MRVAEMMQRDVAEVDSDAILRHRAPTPRPWQTPAAIVAVVADDRPGSATSRSWKATRASV